MLVNKCKGHDFNHRKSFYYPICVVSCSLADKRNKMISGRLSDRDARKTVIAVAFVSMLIASFAVTKVDAAASKVTLSLDIESEDDCTGSTSCTADILVESEVEATITLTSSDTRYRTMQVYLAVSWASGVSWDSEITDLDYDELDDNIVSLDKGGSATVKLIVYCEGACSAGDTNTISVTGKSDPLWYSGGGSGSGCGSDDCSSDTSAPSSSSNVTNTVSIAFTARQGYSMEVECAAASSTGDNKMFQSNSYQWSYTITNTGWNTDTYQFTTVITSNSGAETGFWTISPGLANGKELTGQSDASSSAVHSADGSINIQPATDARPGVYNIKLTVDSTGEAGDSCNFDVVVPEPDLEVKDTDISFSHTGAWIDPRGNSQRVTITAKIRNNGGFADAGGTTATDVEVKFFVDGSQLGKTHTIDSLAYGEETEISVYWNPARAHDSDEAGIPIKVMVDPANNIEETDEDNNQGSTHFQVVRTKASNPSFYIGFLALTAAVGAAVLLSSYYRNKEDLEE